MQRSGKNPGREETEARPATAEQLRSGIGRAKAHRNDEIYPASAASPLGTDDEAGGYPPTGEQVAMAMRQEPEILANRRGPIERPGGGTLRLWLIGVVVIAAVTVLSLMAVSV